MNLAAALHHTVLRQLNSQSNSLESILKKEISESLTVKKEKAIFVIQWKRNGERFKKEYPSSSFKFYGHGNDLAKKNTKQEDYSNENAEPINNIIKDLLGDPNWEPSPPHFSSIEKNTWQSFGIWSLAILASFIASGMQSSTCLLIILLLISLEHFFPAGLWLGILPLAILPWIDSSFSVLFGAFGMLCLTTLTPNPSGRWVHTSTALVAIISFLIWWGTVEHFRFPVIEGYWWAIILCLIPAFFGWILGTNVFLMPLVLPWFGIGFILDGDSLFGIYLGLAIVLRLFANCCSLKSKFGITH